MEAEKWLDIHWNGKKVHKHKNLCTHLDAPVYATVVAMCFVMLAAHVTAHLLPIVISILLHAGRSIICR